MLRFLILTGFIFICIPSSFGQVNSKTTTQPEKRIALIIGNGNYIGSTLANPENDARSMAEVLKELSFDIHKYENLNQSQMKRAIDEFGLKLKGYDVGLFYYAGHGIQAKGYNYLIPVDANLLTEEQVEYDCVRADRVLALMEKSGIKVNIIILDACRNNPFERSWTRSATGRGLAFMSAPRGTLIAYATAPGSTASDGTGKNGLYTSAILESIKMPEYTIIQMFQNVRNIVATKSNNQQMPWESTSLTGDFYFKYDIGRIVTEVSSTTTKDTTNKKLNDSESTLKTNAIQKPANMGIGITSGRNDSNIKSNFPLTSLNNNQPISNINEEAMGLNVYETTNPLNINEKSTYSSDKEELIVTKIKEQPSAINNNKTSDTNINEESTIDDISKLHNPNIKIVTDKVNNILYFGDTRLYTSNDNGKSWSALSPEFVDVYNRLDNLPDTITYIEPNTKVNGEIAVGTKGGSVHFSKDNGKSWKKVHLSSVFIRQIIFSYTPSVFYILASNTLEKSEDVYLIYRCSFNTNYPFDKSFYVYLTKGTPVPNILMGNEVDNLSIKTIRNTYSFNINRIPKNKAALTLN